MCPYICPCRHTHEGTVEIFCVHYVRNANKLVDRWRHLRRNRYCITPIFRVEEIFAIFANLDFARNFPPAKIISTENGISRNFPPAKFSSREIFLPRNFPSHESQILIIICNKNGAFVHITNSSLIVGITGIRNVVKPSGFI